MPQLIFKAVKKEDVQYLSQKLSKDFARIYEVEEDYFIFEYVEATCFITGQADSLYPLIEIKQFARTVEQEKALAELLAQSLQALGYQYSEIYFVYLKEEAYYCK